MKEIQTELNKIAKLLQSAGDVAFKEGKYKNFTGEIDYQKNKGKVKNATFELSDFDIYWKDGTWLKGTFDNGTWEKGKFKNGIFNWSIWKDGTFENGTFKKSDWFDGTWKKGKWDKSNIVKNDRLVPVDDFPKDK